MEPSGADRRAYPRYELMAQVRVKRGSVDYVMELTNISRGGALLSTGSMRLPSWAAAGKKLDIAIIHPETLDAVSVEGEIVRVQEGRGDTRVAVRFEGLGAAVQAEVDALVQLASQLASTAPPPIVGP